MDILIGLDVGTSSLKAVAYAPATGVIVAQAARPTPLQQPRPGWSEFDPLALWRNMAEAIRHVVAALPVGGRIAGVAVASMGEAGVPLAQNGEPLYPIIAWYDARSEPQTELLRRELGAEHIHRITGQQVRPTFAMTKLMWLRENEPDVTRRLALWLSMADYIIWRLSGAAATDYSLASRTMLFDQMRGDWSPELLAFCGVSTDVLPQAVVAGTVVGAVTDYAARETGLPSGVPVASGGHDHLCGALAAAAVLPGSFLDSSGTAQSMMLLTDQFQGGGDVFAHGFSCYRHVLRGRYTLQGGLNTAGAALEWVIKLTSGGQNAYRELFLEAAQAGPGAHGVFCLPYFRGCNSPHVDAGARAVFSGLSLEHGRGDLLRAVIEGLAYHLRENLEHMAQVSTVADGPIIAIGGGNREALVLQTKADVCNRAVVAPDLGEATAVGAALLAGLAVGLFASEEEAAASVRCASRRFEPDAARVSLYGKWYNDLYVKLYPALKDLRI